MKQGVKEKIRTDVREDVMGEIEIVWCDDCGKKLLKRNSVPCYGINGKFYLCQVCHQKNWENDRARIV